MRDLVAHWAIFGLFLLVLCFTTISVGLSISGLVNYVTKLEANYEKSYTGY